MWRVIIRISFFHDTGSRLRNHLAPMFAAMGLQNTHTGTWESQAVGPAQAAAQMTQVLQAVATPQAVPGVDRQAALNHLWVYIDRVWEAFVAHGTYFIVSETSEDRFDEVESLDEAIRIARALVKEGRAGDPISIEHGGRVVRQFVLTPAGAVEELCVR